MSTSVVELSEPEKPAMRSVIHTDQAPRAVGPYSQAVRAGSFVFTAGQIPLDPSTGKLVEGGIAEQTRRVMENLRAVLTAGGTGFERVVKATVFLTDLRSFTAFNQVYAEYFPAQPPARSTVQVAALPLGAAVEIELVALAGGDTVDHSAATSDADASDLPGRGTGVSPVPRVDGQDARSTRLGCGQAPALGGAP